jgi:DMSO/TMAO reductase YedYZ heme-binding membrane subunit
MGDLRHRFLRHHVPLALGSTVVLVLFMTLPTFNANKYTPSDIFSGTLPKDFSGGQTAGEAGHQRPQQQGADHEIPPEQLQQMQQHSGGQTGGGGGGSFLGLGVRRFTFATGYVATGLLALTLLIGPGKLLLRRRNPVSDYLTRDVGTWAAITSVVHVLFGLEVHASITNPIPMFEPWTKSFGLANWTGLAATVIVVGLLAISSDFALRKLKARTWKNLQRLNYVLIALVIVHAFFYGVLLRTDSPYTLLLLLSIIAVIVGQAVGVWLWRRRHARTMARLAGATQ